MKVIVLCYGVQIRCIIIYTNVGNDKVKTKIKQANWKSKPFFNKKDKEYMNIITTVYWQGDNIL